MSDSLPIFHRAVFLLQRLWFLFFLESSAAVLSCCISTTVPFFLLVTPTYICTYSDKSFGWLNTHLYLLTLWLFGAQYLINFVNLKVHLSQALRTRWNVSLQLLIMYFNEWCKPSSSEEWYHRYESNSSISMMPGFFTYLVGTSKCYFLAARISYVSLSWHSSIWMSTHI